MVVSHFSKLEFQILADFLKQETELK